MFQDGSEKRRTIYIADPTTAGVLAAGERHRTRRRRTATSKFFRTHARTTFSGRAPKGYRLIPVSIARRRSFYRDLWKFLRFPRRGTKTRAIGRDNECARNAPQRSIFLWKRGRIANDLSPHSSSNDRIRLNRAPPFRALPLTFKRFHVLLNSLFKVLFNFPSRYLFAIGFVLIFSLRWSLPPDLGCIPEQPDSVESESIVDRLVHGPRTLLRYGPRSNELERRSKSDRVMLSFTPHFSPSRRMGDSALDSSYFTRRYCRNPR